jgi:hypothetical protein
MILLSLTFLVSCSDSNKSDDSGTNPTSTTCGTLTLEECGSQAECYTITAQQMMGTNSGNFCIDWEAEMEGVGCTANLSAMTVEVFAGPPTDPESCWYFRDSNIPEGWVDCNNVIGECPS